MFSTVFLFVVGLLFFVAGILGICTNKRSLENAPLFLFPIVGAGIMFFTIMFNCKIPALKMIQDNIDSIFSTCVMLFCFCVGLALVLGSIYDKKYKTEHCTYPVEAICIDLGEDSSSMSSDSVSGHLYSPSWKYTFHEKEYIYKSNISSTITPPELGEIYTIFIDPSDPEKARIPRYSHNGNFLFIGIIALIIGAVGGYAVLFL